MRSCPPLFRVLLLTALFVVLAVAPGIAGTAGTSPTAPLPQTPTAQAAQATAPSTAAFLATLSPDLSGTPGVLFASGCTSSSQCPTGQLCCLACGASDCTTRACFTPIRGHCPLFS
jgi:hypothetical protein